MSVRKITGFSVTQRPDGSYDFVGESGSNLYPVRLDIFMMRKIALKFGTIIAAADVGERREQVCGSHDR